MQLLFHLVYYHSTCFGHGSCPSSGVLYKTVEAATSVCQCVWGGMCTHTTPHALTHTGGCLYSFVYYSWRWTRNVSETCRVIINQVKQKLHLVGYLLTRYFKDARYHERKIRFFLVECIKPLENTKNKNWYIETIFLLQKVVTHWNHLFYWTHTTYAFIIPSKVMARGRKGPRRNTTTLFFRYL